MMMLRLARAGTKKRPVFHLVAADRRSRRDGRFVENLGYFVPATDVLVLNRERVDYWIGRGAQRTETAETLIKRARKHGNQEPKAKPQYVPKPVKPVELKKPEPAPKKDGAEGSAKAPDDAASASADAASAPADAGAAPPKGSAASAPSSDA
ncbi:MAG: 30S ribosomal protein S16 [Myxococcota bacterium]